MERIIELLPAFDKRSPIPAKNYGVQGVKLQMFVKGKNGAVQFVVLTNWQLPQVTSGWLSEHPSQKEMELFFLPFPMDVGYHSLTPIYEGQKPITKSCKLCNGKPCYYDGSGLAAESMFKVLLEKGSEGVWKELEIFYESIFGKDEEAE